MLNVLGALPSGARLERIKASPRYVDGRFRHPDPILPELLRGAPMPSAREFFARDPRRLPRVPAPIIDPRASWNGPVASGFRVTWLGHSTLLLEIDGARILTDPVWSQRVSPFRFIG